MLRFLPLFAILLSSALSAQPPSKVFTTIYDGVPFTYQRERLDDGSIELTGRYLNTNERFHLEIAPTGLVTGRVGGDPVRFTISKKSRDRLFGRRDRSVIETANAGSVSTISSRR